MGKRPARGLMVTYRQDRMKTTHFAPSDVLKPFVREYLIIESEGGMDHRLLPGTSLVMAFNLGGAMTHFSKGMTGPFPGITLTGLRNSPRLVCEPGCA